MRNTDRWQSKFIDEKSNELLDLIRDLLDEMEVLKWQYVNLQEEFEQTLTLYKHAMEFICGQGLKDEYDEWSIGGSEHYA